MRCSPMVNSPHDKLCMSCVPTHASQHRTTRDTWPYIQLHLQQDMQLPPSPACIEPVGCFYFLCSFFAGCPLVCDDRPFSAKSCMDHVSTRIHPFLVLKTEAGIKVTQHPLHSSLWLA